jgi:hypothetical protein
MSISFGASADAATIYLDGLLSSNCTAGDYSIANRDCSGSAGNAYKDIAGLKANDGAGDMIWVRGCVDSTTPGCSDAMWKYVGPYDPPPGSSSSARTTVKNYNNEQVLFCINPRACKLNYPRDANGKADMRAYGCGGGGVAHWCDGGDHDGEYCLGGAVNCATGGGTCSIKNAHDWYGDPTWEGGAGDEVMEISQNTVVDGIKTWGSIQMSGADNSVVQNSDIGGCGVASQGEVVRWNTTTNGLLKNNFIHHSCQNVDGYPTCSSQNNAWAVFGFTSTYIVENNEVWDYWQGALRIKNVNVPSGDIIFRYNFVRPDTDIGWNDRGEGRGPYCLGAGQSYNNADSIQFYQNLCLQTSMFWSGDEQVINQIAYNNTIIDGIENFWTWYSEAYQDRYNNLSYIHTDGNHHIRHNNNPDMSNVNVDYNLYWSKAPNYGRFDTSGFERASSLAGWQAYTDGIPHSLDDSSVEADPHFVNAACLDQPGPPGHATACKPEDFKRTSYTENFGTHGCTAGTFSIPSGGANGVCGAKAGAYLTGNEVIGVDATTNPYWNLWHAPAVAACADGVDNDGDGNVDLADSNCSGAGDTSESQCGDGVREPGAEVCDGSDFGSETCVTQGFTSGTLACTPGCAALDTSSCTTTSTAPGIVGNLRIVN